MDVASSVIKTNNRISVVTNVTFLYTPSSFSGGYRNETLATDEYKKVNVF